MTRETPHQESDGRWDQVPLLDLEPGIEAQWDELTDAVTRVLDSGQFIFGPEVEAFEEEAAEYLGARHAVGVNSGTDALVIALRALDVGEGDEVVAPSFTFFATAEAIVMAGAEPVFADIDPESYNLDPADVEEKITGRTRALMPVHLFGRPVDMEALGGIADRHGLEVIEDCAQSFGASTDRGMTGTLGAAGAFSFFPSKNLGGFGDGGLVTTDDPDVADVAAMLRTHGSRKKYRNEMFGYNSRLDALQAALLRVRLGGIDRANRGRRRVARRYGELLSDLAGVSTPEVTEGHVFHQYTIRVRGGRRDAARDALAEAGISSAVYYPVPCHRLPVFEERKPALPETERAAEEVLSLPIWPEMPEQAQERVADELASALG